MNRMIWLANITADNLGRIAPSTMKAQTDTLEVFTLTNAALNKEWTEGSNDNFDLSKEATQASDDIATLLIALDRISHESNPDYRKQEIANFQNLVSHLLENDMGSASMPGWSVNAHAQLMSGIAQFGTDAQKQTAINVLQQHATGTTALRDQELAPGGTEEKSQQSLTEGLNSAGQPIIEIADAVNGVNSKIGNLISELS